MTQMVFGQLYRVGFTGFSDNNTETTKIDYLIVGNSVEDIKNRLPYLIDVAEFDRYRIDYCVKEPSRAFVLSTKLEKSKENKPDVIIAREFGSDAFWQSISTTKPGKEAAKKYEIVARTTAFAYSEKAARKKLSERLASMSEHVEVVCEELFAGDGFAKAKDVSMFKAASFVRG